MNFDESLASGPHASLATLVGTWRGTSTLWLKPGDPGTTNPIEVRAESVAYGRALRLAYDTTAGAQQVNGELLLAYYLHDDAWQGAWTDSFHTGTQLMWLGGGEWNSSGPPDLRGTYPWEDTRWGWSVSFELEDDELFIIHSNIPPGMDPIRAALWRCQRVAS